MVVMRMPVNIWRGSVTWLGPAMNSVTTTSSNEVANKRARDHAGAMMGKRDAERSPAARHPGWRTHAPGCG